MRLEFDDGTLLLRDASDGVPFAEWDDRVDEYIVEEAYFQQDGQSYIQLRVLVRYTSHKALSLLFSVVAIGMEAGSNEGGTHT